MTTQPIPSTTEDLIAEIELDFQGARKLGREAYIDMQDGETLIACIRDLVRAQPWIPCSEWLPEVRERLDSPLTSSGGHEVLPLNISVPVIYYDGNSAKSGPLNWFDGGAPINGVTHWMPLPGRPQ
ncbi:hypothetical protein QQF45_17570 [Halopseudomonas aestusnigri]|uniref:hypothetical protein n=1 Tax=Halopseudomonas aestusnigri TaxID=857252 RepID=UPI002555EF25|nr:hypothetical protein [Halopseudomonas aestusnigri]MDL2200854.1 hypothetical protein [Halopseudomonas aestusnigri]